MEKVYDVIIVGAGPAGSTAAKKLASNGNSVLIIEKLKFPRDKPCGGGLTPHLYEKYPDLLPYIENFSSSGKIFVGDNPKELSYFSDKINAGGYCVRSKFDNLLVEDSVSAGAKFIDGERVLDVKIDNDGVVIETKSNIYFGKVVIGADGPNGVVSKKTGLKKYWDKNEISYCLKIEEEFPEEVMLKYFTKYYTTIWHAGYGNTNGYGYVFPKKNHLNIGFGTTTPQKLPYRKILMNYIQFLEEKDLIPKLKTKKITAGIYPICGPIKNFVDNRVLLLGDAAGFVNPINGEGIHYAIYSGDIAAEVLIDAFKANDFSKRYLMIYRKKCMKSFGNYLRKCTLLPSSSSKGYNMMLKYGKIDEKVKSYTKDMFKEWKNPIWTSMKLGLYLTYKITKNKISRK